MNKFVRVLWDERYNMLSTWGVIVSLVMGVVLLIMGIAIPNIFCAYKTAVCESQLYNEIYGTHYSVSQFFWAGGIIKDYINKGQQKTFNIEGIK